MESPQCILFLHSALHIYILYIAANETLASKIYAELHGSTLFTQGLKKNNMENSRDI